MRWARRGWGAVRPRMRSPGARAGAFGRVCARPRVHDTPHADRRAGRRRRIPATNGPHRARSPHAAAPTRSSSAGRSAPRGASGTADLAVGRCRYPGGIGSRCRVTRDRRTTRGGQTVRLSRSVGSTPDGLEARGGADPCLQSGGTRPAHGDGREQTARSPPSGQDTPRVARRAGGKRRAAAASVTDVARSAKPATGLASAGPSNGRRVERAGHAARRPSSGRKTPRGGGDRDGCCPLGEAGPGPGPGPDPDPEAGPDPDPGRAYAARMRSSARCRSSG